MGTDRSALNALLEPRSVAIVGASANLTRMSGVIVSKLRQFGFTGEVYPVNPRYDEIAGFPCLPSVTDLKDRPPDVAVVYVRADEAVRVARQCAEIGVRALVVLSAGFAETGAAGRELQDELTQIVTANKMALCGPNTAGMANFNYGFVAFGTTNVTSVDSFEPGDIALISASGGLAASILSYSRARHMGLSQLIGIGNEAVTTAADYLDVLIDRPEVRCVLTLLESLWEPEAFFAAADRALAAGKPVIMLKQGRSEVGMRAMLTHTAALGGRHAAFEAACRAHGVVMARDLKEMVDLAMLATRVPRSDGYRLGVVSLPGGGKPLVADAASDHGFEVPPLSESTAAALRPILPPIAVAENPVDPTAGFGRDGERFRNGLRTFWNDPNFDVAVFYQSATEPAYSQTLADNVVAVAGEIGKPLVAVWESGPGLEDGAWATLHRSGIPLFATADACFAALAAHRRYAAMRESFEPEAARDYGPLAGTGRDLLAGLDLTAPEAATLLLDRIGVARPASVVATSAEQAVSAAAAMAGPVAMKLHRPALTHKTEAGGVRLNLTDQAQVAAAFDEIRAAVSRLPGSPALESVLIQQMVPDGVEILVGVHTDEQVGPVLTVGLGGVLTELLGDVAHHPVPVSRTAAHEMISQLRGAPLLQGFRSTPRRDQDALVDIVLRVSWAAHQLRESAPELELNPVMVHDQGDGAVAVDWVFDVAAASTGGRSVKEVDA